MKDYKVFIGVGHGGTDSGAVGNGMKEKDITLKVATYCKNYLQKYGINVMMSRYKDENDSVTEEVKECNAYDPDVAIDVHVNAGGGDGFEAFYHYAGGVGKTLAQNIESEVKKAGQNSRGCKIKKNSSGKDYYAFIRNTKCPAVICELGFIDNKTDLAAFDTDAEMKKFGEAYAKGILKTLDVDTTTDVSRETYLVKVTDDALNIRSGAGAEYSKVGCITDHGVYTIVKEKKASDGGTWGLLKSYAEKENGWINLYYTKKV